MIRRSTESDFQAIFEVINDAAIAYKGIIPADRWHEPYMSAEALRHEIEDGVEFRVYESGGEILGAMGIQDKGDVVLIRHAYVRTRARRGGIGAQLLRNLETLTRKPILIGTWTAAAWAVSFYEKNGYRLLSRDEIEHLLKRYWNIPQRQVETSVVLAKGWPGAKV